MFTVTKDHTADEGATPIFVEVFKMPLYGIERVMGVADDLPGGGGNVIEFRAYDDDDDLMLEGMLDDDPECENQSAVLRYSESFAGCTYIKVKRGSQWVQEIG